MDAAEADGASDTGAGGIGSASSRPPYHRWQRRSSQRRDRKERKDVSRVVDPERRADQWLSRATRRLPLLVASIMGILWSGVYIIAGRLHGMWPMFNGRFPFLIASLFRIRPAAIPWRFGALLAFADGALVTFVMVWLLHHVFR
jgi:hypothetical protein